MGKIKGIQAKESRRALRDISNQTNKEIKEIRKQREVERRKRNIKMGNCEIGAYTYIGYGNKKLTSKQENELKDLKDSIDRNVENTKETSMITRLFSSRTFRYGLCTLVIISIIGAALRINKINSNDISDLSALTSTNISTGKTDTVLKVSMDNETNELQYSLNNIAIQSGDKTIYLKNISWISNDIGTDTNSYSIDDKEYSISNKLKMHRLDITEDKIYIQYVNEENTASKELILSTSKPNEVKVDELQRKDSRTYEKAGPLSIRIYRNSYDEAFIMLSEQLAGGKLTDKSLVNEMDKIEGSIVLKSGAVKTSIDVKGFDSEGNTENTDTSGNIIVQLDGLGEINLNKIGALGNGEQLVYDNDTEVLRIRDAVTDIEYAYICGIGNEVIKCSAEELLATTTENLFIHKDFDIEGSAGYRVFAIKTDYNLYILKVESEDVAMNILEQLGMGDSEFVVKKVQTVIPVNGGVQ